MKSYILNKLCNKVEVYKTVYVKPGRKPYFYSGSTLFIYAGSLPISYNHYNRNHRQVEDCKNGDHSSQPYYGGRTIGGYFEILTRKQVINIFKNKNATT